MGDSDEAGAGEDDRRRHPQRHGVCVVAAGGVQGDPLTVPRDRARRSTGQPVQPDVQLEVRALRSNQQEDAMGIFSWIVLGAIAGWLASMIMNRSGEGLARDIL